MLLAHIVVMTDSTFVIHSGPDHGFAKKVKIPAPIRVW